MDRIFLDANVIFSAAYRPHSSLLNLWAFNEIYLITSSYAVEEAIRNLGTVAQKDRLIKFIEKVAITTHEEDISEFPKDIILRDKDKPILLSAIKAEAKYLLTGDKRDFGKYFGQTIQGVMIIRPSEYFKMTEK